MTTMIKGGTIVTADLTYKADVKIDAGKFIDQPPFAAPARALSTWKQLTATTRVVRSGIPSSGV